MSLWCWLTGHVFLPWEPIEPDGVDRERGVLPAIRQCVRCGEEESAELWLHELVGSGKRTGPWEEFTCRQCGVGEWDMSWWEPEYPGICPNCLGST